MKSIKTYVPVIIAVRSGTDNINAFSELINPLICIANKPIICFSLEYLTINEFEEVIIVTSVTWEENLRVIVDECLKGKLKAQYIVINDIYQVVGTVECLRRLCAQETLIKDKDIVVMSYDLISEVSFSILDELHRKTDSSLTILLSQKPSLQDVPIPVPMKHKKQEREITVFSEGVLVHIARESGMDGKLNLKASLLKNACNFEVHSDLVDCHMYLLSYRCLQCLKEQSFVSLENDFIPWLINNSYDESVYESVSVDLKKKYKSGIEDSHSEVVNRSGRRLVCQAHVHNTTEVCMRVHNVATFCAANFMLSKQGSKLAAKKHTVKGMTVCGDSNVGEGVEAYGKVNIKASVVGAYCSIGSNCRLSNSIVMSHAIIQQNVNLENTIVCESARIGEGSVLKDCLVPQGQPIPTGNYSNKEILPNDRLIPV